MLLEMEVIRRKHYKYNIIFFETDLAMHLKENNKTLHENDASTLLIVRSLEPKFGVVKKSNFIVSRQSSWIQRIRIFQN